MIERRPANTVRKHYRAVVWQSDDGKMYVSKMSMGLLTKMFGGNISKVVGAKVVKDEKPILSGILAGLNKHDGRARRWTLKRKSQLIP